MPTGQHHPAIRLAAQRRGKGAWRAAILLTLAPTLAVAAEPAVSQVKAGAWQQTTFRDPANPGCSIGGPGSMPGGRLIMGANRLRPDPMNLVVRKTGWTIPDSTAVQVQAAFPDGTVMRFAGRGKGNAIEVPLSPDQVRDWVHGLTASTAMQLSFGGTEPPWTFDLTGTTTVINAMGDCFRGLGIVGVAPPFGLAGAEAPTQPFAPGPSTQPFGGPPPGAVLPPPATDGGMKAPMEPPPAAPSAAADPALPAPRPVPAMAQMPPPDAPRATMPASEAALLAAVDTARRAYRTASDDLGRAAVRPARAGDICRAVPAPEVVDWTGTVAARGMAGSRGTIAIRLAPGLVVKTWDDAAADFGDGTLIDQASPTFQAAAPLQAGQRVRFSASLIPDRADCYREAGTSLAGSINEPAFIMRLEAVQAIP